MGEITRSIRGNSRGEGFPYQEKAVGDISAVVNYDTLTTSQQAIFYPIERRAVYAGVRANW